MRLNSAEMTHSKVNRQKMTKVPDAKSCVYTNFSLTLELTLREMLKISKGPSLRKSALHYFFFYFFSLFLLLKFKKTAIFHLYS